MAVELLDGILSDEKLDQIAEDLGIDPVVMRKHPLFRVLKGRILLTYPVKGSWGNMQVSDVITLLDTETHLIPKGYHFAALKTGDADFASLKLQIDDGTAVFRSITDMALVNTTTWKMLPGMIISDGTNLRLLADGADIGNIYYVYHTQ